MKRPPPRTICPRRRPPCFGPDESFSSLSQQLFGERRSYDVHSMEWLSRVRDLLCRPRRLRKSLPDSPWSTLRIYPDGNTQAQPRYVLLHRAVSGHAAALRSICCHCPVVALRVRGSIAPDVNVVRLRKYVSASYRIHMQKVFLAIVGKKYRQWAIDCDARRHREHVVVVQMTFRR